MPTQRPFFSNFLAAFRAQSALQKAATSSATSSATASAAQNSFASSQTSAATAANNASRAMTTKASPQATSSSIAIQSSHQFQPSRHHASSPYSRSPGSPASHTGGGYGSRQRRGSDSSSEGWRDVQGVNGGEKWYIGGRAPNGEERFYRLGVVKRPRSVDRLSCDRLSL